jgi:flagellin
MINDSAEMQARGISAITPITTEAFPEGKYPDGSFNYNLRNKLDLVFGEPPTAGSQGVGTVTFAEGVKTATLTYKSDTVPAGDDIVFNVDADDLNTSAAAINGDGSTTGSAVHGLVATVIAVDDGSGGQTSALSIREAVVPDDISAPATAPADPGSMVSSVTENKVELTSSVAVNANTAVNQAAGEPSLTAKVNASSDARTGLFTPTVGKKEITISLGNTDVVVSELAGDGSRTDGDKIASTINSGKNEHKFTAIANDDGTVTITAPTYAQDMDVTDDDKARKTIVAIDAAIQTVNIQRSKLGAVSNRLSHTINNLTNISSNLSAAQGGIEDADFAHETTMLAKNQILQQASTAMLAQANASKQNVLSLLQG